MPTRPDLEKAFREKYPTIEDFKVFRKQFGGHFLDGRQAWTNSEQIYDANLKSLLDECDRQPPVKIGLCRNLNQPLDHEEELERSRRAEERAEAANRKSNFSIGIAAAALVVTACKVVWDIVYAN